MVVIQSVLTGLGEHAEAILRALPKWFGIEEAIQHYIDFANENLTFIATVDEKVVGFLRIEQHSPQAAEIYAMGVLPRYHRQGIGRALLQTTEAYLRDNTISQAFIRRSKPQNKLLLVTFALFITLR